jgi:hypothetical protein
MKHQALFNSGSTPPGITRKKNICCYPYSLRQAHSSARLASSAGDASPSPSHRLGVSFWQRALIRIVPAAVVKWLRTPPKMHTLDIPPVDFCRLGVGSPQDRIGRLYREPLILLNLISSKAQSWPTHSLDIQLFTLYTYTQKSDKTIPPAHTYTYLLLFTKTCIYVCMHVYIYIYICA